MRDVCKFHAGGNQKDLRYYTPRFNRKEKNNSFKCGKKKFYNHLTAEKKEMLCPYFPVMLWFSNAFPLISKQNSFEAVKKEDCSAHPCAAADAPQLSQGFGNY